MDFQLSEITLLIENTFGYFVARIILKIALIQSISITNVSLKDLSNQCYHFHFR